MPKKLLDCVKKVMASGKDRSSAIAICVKSTGMKMTHSEVEKLLEDNNITERAGNNFMKMKLLKKKDVVENFDNPFSDVTEASVDPDNYMIKGVCLFGTRESANNRIYSDKAIGSLATLSEGVKCFINHPMKTEIKERDGVRDLRDWVGVYESARQDGQKIFADLKCRESYWDLVKDIAYLQPKNVGNSINAQVKVHVDDKGLESVVDATLLRSVDLVSNAATTSSLFESAIEKNMQGEEELDIENIRTGDVKKTVEEKFAELIAKEGILQDQIDNDELKKEVNKISWIAFDMMDRALYDSKLSVEDKKKQVIAIFDDLDKEIKKRLPKIKKESQEGIETMEFTLNDVKSNKVIMEALTKEFEEKENVEKTKADLATATESATKLAKDLEGKDAVVKEKDEKITALESENKTLKVKLDEIEVAEKIAEKKATIDKMVAEAELPKEAVTEVFMDTLYAVEAKGEGDKAITVEDQVKKLIEDRKSLVNIKESKGKVKGSGDEFVEKVKQDKKLSRKDVGEAVEDFVDAIK